MRRRPTGPLLSAMLLAALVALASTCLQAAPPDTAYDPRRFGAKADGETLDTPAIQAAIDAAHQAGGGTVVLRGGDFLSGTLVLKSHVELHVAGGAILRGSLDIDDYPDHTPSVEYLYRDRFTKSLVFADGAEDIALSGQGLIDGQGEHFKARQGDDKLRPYLVRLSACRNVRVRDLHFRNSARWLSHYLACDDVVIDGITIDSRIRMNRDGIGIDSCSDVRIANCHVYSGDDAIVLKATARRPCRRVTITNCTVSSMASALKLGTESNGGFEDVTITNCVIYDTGYSGIGIMSVDGATLDRVTVSNITMNRVKVPIFVRLGDRARPMPGDEPPGVGALRNVTISNVEASGVGEVGASITGIPGHPVEGITLDNIRVRYAGGGSTEDARRSVPERIDAYPSGKMFGLLPAYGLYCRHATNLRLHNLDFALDEPDGRPALVCDDIAALDLFGLRADATPNIDEPLVRLHNVRGALVHGCRAAEPTRRFLKVTGARSTGIAIEGCDLDTPNGATASAPGDDFRFSAIHRPSHAITPLDHSELNHAYTFPTDVIVRIDGPGVPRLGR